MRRHHTGSGRRNVIPADWQTHHGIVATQATEDVACTVTIGAADGGAAGYDPVNGYTVTTSTPVYTGPASVMVLMAKDRRLAVVEDEVTSQFYRVFLPLEADGAVITTAHVIRVTASDDPLLAGVTLQIAAVDRGSRRFSRTLLATLND